MSKIKHKIRMYLDKSYLGRIIIGLYGRYTLRSNFRADCRLLRQEGPDLLRIVNDVASNTGLRYFACYGTLLGIIRDGGFIKHDKDIDICIEAGTFSPCKLMIALLDKGFSFYRAFEYEDHITELCLKYHGVPVDFFFLERMDDMYMLRSYHWEEGRGDSWKMNLVYMPVVNRIDENKVFPGKDFKIPIPENYEEILDMNYGDWRTPVANWDFNHGDRYCKKLEDSEGRGLVVGINRVLDIG